MREDYLVILLLLYWDAPDRKDDAKILFPQEKFFEKLLQSPLKIMRYSIIIKTQKRKGEHENDRNEIFRNRGWYT